MAHEKLTFQELDTETKQFLTENFASSLKKNFIKCKTCVLPDSFKNLADGIKNMQIRDDDVWVCTFPKTGTTWIQEMAWCLANNVDLEAASKKTLLDRFLFLEFSIVVHSESFIKEKATLIGADYLSNPIKYIDNHPSPRFIKTHLPFDLLPEKLKNFSTRAKIIHMVRNPRDTLISYYHHCKLMDGYKGSFLQFAQLFFEGNVPYGSFPAHVRGFLEHKNNPNILFLSYEEMQKDLKLTIRKTAKFLEKQIGEDDVEKLQNHLSFSNMKDNPSVNLESIVQARKKLSLAEEDGHFIRRGVVGEWKEKMNPELCAKFEKWEQDNLNGIDFTLFN